MKKLTKIILGVGFAFYSTSLFAQNENVGIGTISPDASAVLDLNSNSKGLLIPRMSIDKRNSIKNPAQGLLIYQTDSQSGFYYFDGKDWQSNMGEKSVAVAGVDWLLTGNAATSTQFLGTTNAEPLRFQVSNNWAGIISPGGTNAATMIGYATGPRIGATANNNTAIGFASMGGEVLTTVTGSSNSAMGYNALGRITSGTGNVAIGESSLRFLQTGGYNFGLGGSALRDLVQGSDNVAIGYAALASANSGISNSNIAIGAYALTNNQGGANIAIGAATGEFKNGTGNVYIGHNAGRVAATTNENNTLYIANTNTVTPLIYGDFSAKYVTIGDVTPSQRSQGVATGGYNLLVKGGILTEKVKVAVATTGDWADYVFEPTYKLMSLENVEQFTKDNKHLPNVPSAEQLAKDGLDLGQTSKMFMEKIEELTLYVIEMNKEIKALKEENKKLKK